ncbi:hypothetical protein [Latilactobacillus graminis]|uniref:Uncharacterized protein n=2 Tax=Latilactobacillus graminis TaxID=60519 RepID=A0AA89I6S2_9LACO|nr:hypothetical protein [Latilactobacillus graminis]KRM24248.1 hypothetical protein FC90_GL000725 [Latilactobacillus graminis DSM 20719]QFP78772.1 hypothetical protein LG542_00245 [Latilactobacillus graminis]
MATAIEKTLVLDMKMSEVFEWSDDDTIVRDALWNHYMEANAHNTDQTVAAMKPYLKMSNADVKEKAEALLK